jgi:hypothetical protein
MAGGHENLIPMSERTKDEQRDIATKGGIASGEARRAKRDFRASMMAALAEMVDRRDDKGNVIDKIPAQDAICLKQIMKALKGDTTAAKFCVEVSTEKQKQQYLGGFKFVVEPGDDEI